MGGLLMCFGLLVMLGGLSLELPSSYLWTIESLLCLLHEFSLSSKLGLTAQAGEELGEAVSITEGARKFIKLEVGSERNIELW